MCKYVHIASCFATASVPKIFVLLLVSLSLYIAASFCLLIFAV